MTPCKKLEEVRNRALRFIRLEEDKKTQSRKTPPSITLTGRINIPPKNPIELNLLKIHEP